jgi:SAM-dependent methyltransferase
MTDWFEDEDFWRLLFPFVFPQERLDRAEDEVDSITALAGFEKGRVLDLCCGPGRHSIALAKRGARVTGVDLSAFLLERAASHALANSVDVEWVHQDMREFIRAGAFELVINVFTSFGYFDDKNDDIKVLENVFKSLETDGKFLIELASKEWLAKVFQPTTSEKLVDGSLLIQCHEIFDDWSRIRNEWIVVRDGRATPFVFHHTVYSAQEMKDRLRLVGFENVRAFGDLSGSAYGTEAERLVLLAEKSGR